MQTEIQTTNRLPIRIISTETGCQLDTRPAGAVGLDLQAIDQLVDALQAEAARLRAQTPEGQMGLFDKVAQ